MVIYLFNLPSEDLNIRTHLKTSFIVIGTLLSGICHIFWKILNNKLNTCFFHWDLGKVLTSFINLAYRALSQTYNMPENVMIFIHLLAFAMIWQSFPAKTVFNLQLAQDSFLDENSKVCSSPYPCLFILLGHLQQTTFFRRMRSQELIAFQDTCTLVPALPAASCWSSHRFSSPILVAPWLRTCSLQCTYKINSITGPWYWLELLVAMLKYILTAIIRINKKC